MMKQLFNTAFDNRVVAFVSDKSVDFKLNEGQTVLTDVQKEYLCAQVGHSIDDVINIQQVHGKDIVILKDVYDGKYVMQEADGIITNITNLPIVIRTADCVPLYIYDPNQEVIGVIHAGWQSTKQRIAKEAVVIFQNQFQSDPKNLRVLLGPAIQKNSFEVGEEFRDYFPNEFEEIDGSFYVDVVQANINQLLDASVDSNNIFNSKEDTYTNAQYFSFRRDGQEAGRMLHLMYLRK